MPGLWHARMLQAGGAAQLPKTVTPLSLAEGWSQERSLLNCPPGIAPAAKPASNSSLEKKTSPLTLVIKLRAWGGFPLLAGYADCSGVCTSPACSSSVYSRSESLGRALCSQCCFHQPELACESPALG